MKFPTVRAFSLLLVALMILTVGFVSCDKVIDQPSETTAQNTQGNVETTPSTEVPTEAETEIETEVESETSVDRSSHGTLGQFFQRRSARRTGCRGASALFPSYGTLSQRLGSQADGVRSSDLSV